MNKQPYFHGTVTGDGKVYEMPNIPAHRLERVKARITNKGGILTIRGHVPLAPAAPSLVRENRLGLGEITQKNQRVDKSKTKDKSNWGGQLKPVINVTTGVYYPSVTDAALSLGAPPSNVTTHLKGGIKKVKGNVFRYATEEEKAARQIGS